MSSVNKVILIGNLGQNPEVKTLDDGSKLATFSLATSESWKDKSGERQTKTTWLNCEVWQQQADIVEKYLQKGSKIYLEGKIKIDEYMKGEEKRYATKIVVSNFIMLDSKKDSESQSGQHSSMSQPSQGSSAFDDDDSENSLPF